MFAAASVSREDVTQLQKKRLTLTSRLFEKVPARVGAAAVSLASSFQQAGGRKTKNEASDETEYFLIGLLMLAAGLLFVSLAIVTCCKGRRAKAEDGVELRRQVVANRALADKVTTLERELVEAQRSTQAIDREASLWISKRGAGACFHINSDCVGLREARGLRQLRACRV